MAKDPKMMTNIRRVAEQANTDLGADCVIMLVFQEHDGGASIYGLRSETSSAEVADAADRMLRAIDMALDAEGDDEMSPVLN